LIVLFAHEFKMKCTLVPILLWVILPLPSNGKCSSAEQEHAEDNHPRRKIYKYPTRSARVSRIRPSERSSSESKPLFVNPLTTNVTLSEKLASIPRGGSDGESSNEKDSDFAKRLKEQEEEEELAAASAATTSNQFSSSAFGWTLIGTAASFFVASTVVLSPSVVWKDVISGINTILSLHWIHQLSQQPLTAFIDVFVAAHLLAKPGTVESIQKKVWPTVISTFKTMLLAEAWSYFWKLTWKTLSRPEDKESVSSATSQLPEWLPKRMGEWWMQTNKFVEGFMQRGTRRVIQKVLQKNIQDTVFRLASHGASVFQEQWYSKAITSSPTSMAASPTAGTSASEQR